MQRWQDEVPDIKNVISIADLDDIGEVKQPAPAGIVFYDGDDVLTGEGGSRDSGSQVIDQRWGLVVAVRNVRNIRGGASARQEASPLILATITAFAGWTPKKGYRAMRRGSAPGPAYDKGYAYFPLLFTTRVFT
ncbi:MAG: hypothetical protein WD750_05780 [Gammaproteobacteria bacterium]